MSHNLLAEFQELVHKFEPDFQNTESHQSNSLATRSGSLSSTLPHASSTKNNEPISSAPSSAFNKAAGDIARNLQRTAKKIQDLTHLVRRRGVYETSHVQSNVDELTKSIKSDVISITNQLNTLHSHVLSQKAEVTRRGAVPGRSSVTANPLDMSNVDTLSTVHGINHSETIITALQEQLQSFSGDFQSALSAQCERIEQTSNRRSIFGVDSTVGSLGRPISFNQAPPNPINRSLAPAGQGTNRNSGDFVVELGDSRPLLARSNASQAQSFGDNAFQLVTVQEQSAASTYAQQRAMEVQRVNESVAEVSELFARLATLVQAQGAQIERLDDDLESATMDLERGQDQLVRFYDNVRSNKALILKIFGILVVFMILFAIFA